NVSGALGGLWGSMAVTAKAAGTAASAAVRRNEVMIDREDRPRTVAANRAVTPAAAQAPQSSIAGFTPDEVARMGDSKMYFAAGMASLDKSSPDTAEAFRQADAAEAKGAPPDLVSKLRWESLKKLPAATNAWLKDHGMDE